MRTIYPEYRTQIDTYAAGTQTWTQPVGAAFIHVTCIGSGGGGGSGARYAAGTYRGGGQGGQGGAFNTAFLPAALVAPTVTVTVGYGGVGGIGIDYDYGNGDPGVPGNNPTMFGTYVLALAGLGGEGGTDTPFNVDDMPRNYAFVQSLYARTFGTVNDDNAEGAVGCPGGASGGSIGADDVPHIGGLGARSYGSGPQLSPSVLPGQNGPDSVGLVPGPGSSGAGGSAPGAIRDPDAIQPENWPGDGGRGGRYGAGGAGGGASTNGTVSGAGGNGAEGICVVTTFF